ncbi:MAG: hypothetical protein ACMXYE_01535 [Candidatus Woesearchaeota archaeon]
MHARTKIKKRVATRKLNARCTKKRSISISEQALLKSALGVSIIGIFMLWVFMHYSSFPEVALEDASHNPDYERFITYGIVKDVHETDAVVQLTLGEQRWIEQRAVHFKEKTEPLGIREDQFIRVLGYMHNGRMILSEIDVYE